MRDLFDQKYNIKAITLPHSFSEKYDRKVYDKNIEKSIFWGGSIYSINKNSVKRLYEVFSEMGYRLNLSSVNNYKNLSKLGFDHKNIEILPFVKRNEYIEKVKSQKALLLSIDWPDESIVHVDELRTIFPTKTIEYLISGRPIIVHCPENYFLAKFFNKYNCGIVITKRKKIK